MLYGEDIFVGYRYYDTKKIPVRWSFGHGLSYTTFEYSNMHVSSYEMTDGDVIEVSVDVENVGSISGSEVVQLYVSSKDNVVPRAEKELKGFAKVFLKPQEKKTVIMELQAKDLAYFETKINDWYTPTGNYHLLIGHSSTDIRLHKEILFTSHITLPFHVDMNTTIGELFSNAKTVGKMQSYLEHLNQEEKPEENEGVELITQEILFQMPLRSFLSVIPGEMVEQMINELNELCNVKGNENHES